MQELVHALERIPGVTRVHVELDEEQIRALGPTAEASSVEDPPSQWLPRGLLFEPLHADPRWPRFALPIDGFQTGV